MTKMIENPIVKKISTAEIEQKGSGWGITLSDINISNDFDTWKFLNGVIEANNLDIELSNDGKFSDASYFITANDRGQLEEMQSLIGVANKGKNC